MVADDARDCLVTLPERFSSSPATRKVTVDVSDLRFVDAAGVRALLAAKCRVDAGGQGRLRVRGARPMLSKIAGILGLSDALNLSANHGQE